MKGLIKKFVLVTLFLHLCLFQQAVGRLPQPALGDLLRFDRKVPCTNKTLYSHYAVYVDDANIQGKQPGQDIFEMTSWNGGSGCRFSTLQGEFHIDNYKDDTLRPQNDNEIILAVQDLNGKCGRWTPSNTCEHTATSVRYGDVHRQCNQNNTTVGPVCCLFNYFRNLINNTGCNRRSKYLRANVAAAAA